MLTLLENLNARVLTHEVPAFGIAMLLAEFFYKFHSFSLECVAFCLTWGALSFIIKQLK